MTKWGEGDLRWIVEERTDATNRERDVTSWSHEAINSLHLGIRVEGEEGSCEITDISNINGKASINNRKGKLIYFYEWVVKEQIKWESNLKGLEIPNLSDENDMDDLDICVTFCKDQPSTPLSDLMRKEGVKKIRMALGNFHHVLVTCFYRVLSGMILPSEKAFNKKNQEAQAKAKLDKTQIGSSTTRKPPNTVVKIPTVSLTMKDAFLTSPEELYRMVQAFTHLAAFVDGCSGGKFRLLEGNVYGQFAELIPDQKIVMKWRFSSWPDGHAASVILSFVNQGSETELILEARGVLMSSLCECFFFFYYYYYYYPFLLVGEFLVDWLAGQAL
uniref:AHA1, activator of heat shock protein ATPase homolog 1a n=1 Tax=Sinocyclocheilus grahami TaxID=75366 RepID=A0A672JWV1_SINGR